MIDALPSVLRNSEYEIETCASLVRFNLIRITGLPALWKAKAGLLLWRARAELLCRDILLLPLK